MLEEFHGFIHRHIQYIADRLPLIPDLQCFPVVAPAIAFFTMHINIRQEIHFYHPQSAAFTHIAPASFYIERKTACIVTPDFGFRYCGKQLTDICKKIAVGGRIAAGRSADWRLIDFNHLVNVFQSTHTFIRHGILFGAKAMLIE